MSDPSRERETTASGDASEADLVERVVESRVLHQGRYLTFRVDTVELPDGSRTTRDIAGHPGAVAIVALDDEERVALVRQYRVPAGRALLEIPAGGLDIDATGVKEDPEAAARRELEEETGLRAGSWRHLASFYTAPGFTEELMHLFLATDLSPAHPDGRLGPDADERLVLEWLPWRDAIAAVERGDICDGKSLVGLLWLERLLDGAPATTAADTKSHTPGEPTGAIGDVVAITYRLSMREWVAANVALVRRSLGMRLFGLALIALGIVGLWLTGDWISNGLALVLGVALLTGAFVAPFAWYQARRRRDLIFAEQSIEADANGLRFRGPTGTSSLSWDTFRRVHETRSYFFLDTNVGQNFVVPRRAFAPAELAAFYRLLQRAGLLAPTGGR